MLGEAGGATAGLEQGTGAVIEGGIDGFKTRQLRHEALVNPMGQQSALAALGLVRRVSGGQVADVVDFAIDGGHTVKREAIAQKGGGWTITRGHGGEVGLQVFVGKLFG